MLETTTMGEEVRDVCIHLYKALATMVCLEKDRLGLKCSDLAAKKVFQVTESPVVLSTHLKSRRK